jgi:hypothetical protein
VALGCGRGLLKAIPIHREKMSQASPHFFCQPANGIQISKRPYSSTTASISIACYGITYTYNPYYVIIKGNSAKMAYNFNS